IAFAPVVYQIPYDRMYIVRNGTNRTLTILPATNQTGQTIVTVEALDAAAVTATRSFIVTVTNVNDPPFISTIPSQTNLYSAEPLTVAFTVGDPDTPANQLQLSAVSVDQALVPSTNILFGGTGTSPT